MFIAPLYGRRPLRYEISIDDQIEVDPREHDWRFFTPERGSFVFTIIDVATFNLVTIEIVVVLNELVERFSFNVLLILS